MREPGTGDGAGVAHDRLAPGGLALPLLRPWLARLPGRATGLFHGQSVRAEGLRCWCQELTFPQT